LSALKFYIAMKFRKRFTQFSLDCLSSVRLCVLCGKYAYGFTISRTHHRQRAQELVYRSML
jgi:hypothetical protein